MKNVYWVVEANGKEIGAMTLDEFEDIQKSVKANWMNRTVAVIRFFFFPAYKKTGLYWPEIEEEVKALLQVRTDAPLTIKFVHGKMPSQIRLL
ncbi:hypothetical protein LZP59_002433 [Salmonella enterica]|nr:hypothetical protein [Salmonella enterica]EBW3175170.1 hypothetical protein [Salmonella enterica subsp. enterica serovar Javiana]ECG2456671.1 hypothetical protein [Salmonella enterica subsp. enterica serovar Infantis]ECJ7384576.1 hypothetical protein [Salmonella enterica subsp. enterica serovar Infantis]EDW7076329.1 hypothetical protein [Salmonella enterica subsp. enterica serovar Javiana]